MTSKIKVNILADGGDNSIITSDGAGSFTASSSLASSVQSVGGLQNTPAFRARLSSNQSVSGATWTVLSLATEDFDIGGYYDNSTYRWTPPSGGKFYIHFQVRNSTGQDYMYCSIFKNGTTEVAMAQATISSAGILSSGAIITPNGTDYYNLQVNPGTGSTIAAGEGFTFFEAFKLIGA